MTSRLGIRSSFSSWTPVDLARTLRKNHTTIPKQITVHDKKYAVYWHDNRPKFANDVCSHRGASLSAGGQVILENGCLKCKYHGHPTKPLVEEICERDGIVWMNTSPFDSKSRGVLPPDETEPPTSWEFSEERMRVFEYTRAFEGCSPILTVENTLDFSHLDTVHLFHLIEGRPQVTIVDSGYHGKALYKYKSKVFQLVIENEYLGPWSSCLRFVFDEEHAFTLHFAVRPESKKDCTVFVRVSRPPELLSGPLNDVVYMLINELPLWEDRYIVRHADPLSWDSNNLTSDDAFLKKYRGYMSEHHMDLIEYYLRC